MPPAHRIKQGMCLKAHTTDTQQQLTCPVYLATHEPARSTIDSLPRRTLPSGQLLSTLTVTMQWERLLASFILVATWGAMQVARAWVGGWGR